MEQREMASDKGATNGSGSAGLSIISTGELSCSGGSGNKLHLLIGRRTGGDSANHSNEDLDSSDLFVPALDDRHNPIIVEPGTDALTLAEPTDSSAGPTGASANGPIPAPGPGPMSSVGASNGTNGSASVEPITDASAATNHEESFSLTPMPNIDDSAFLLDNGDKGYDVSSRVSSTDDIGHNDMTGDTGGREPGSTTSDLSSPPFSANTLSDISDSTTPLRDCLIPEKELSRSTNGHISDSGSRGLNDSTNLSINSSNNSNSSNSVSKSSKSTDKKKRGSYWYNSALNVMSDAQNMSLQSYLKVLSPTYKSRSEDFKRLFKDIPNDERLMVDYGCALQKDILVHGRLYVTQNWICFYANIFRWETVLTIRCRDITSMTKERTARVIPNAIQVCTENEKYFFTTFGARDKTYLMMFRVWQNALLDQPMSLQELWQWVHYSYGEELGLNSSDDDYRAPTKDEEEKFQKILTQEEMSDTQADKEAQEERPVVLNAGENGHVLPIPSPVNTKLSSPSPVSTQSDVSMVTNSAEDVREGGESTTGAKHPVTRLEVPSPGTSAELPTDQGDTTEEEEDEVLCVGHDHPGFTTLDDVFDMSCDQLFELLFTESQFYQDFVKARKTYDLVLSPWPVEPDVENKKTRVITYTLSLNYSIGPKCSPSTEKQTLYGDSKPGSFYVLDCEVVNGGIPYGDNFYVVNRYCIMRVSSRKTRLRVTSDLRYRKTAWGLVKNIIEKNAHTGLHENFSLLAQHLHAEVEKRQALSPPINNTQAPPRKKVFRRRRCPSNTDRSPSVKRPAETTKPGSSQGSPKKVQGSKDEWQLQFNADSVVRVVCTVLLLLVLFNAVLFYKLWSLEARAASPRYDRQSILNDLGSTARSQEEWLAILEQQQQLHDLELERWKDILSSSVQLMEQMKNVLQGLQSSIEKRSRVVMDTAAPGA